MGAPTPGSLAQPWAHRIFGNLKTWFRGTFHGVSPKHLQRYLDEFAFRFDRRWRETELFIRVLHRTLDAAPCPYPEATPWPDARSHEPRPRRGGGLARLAGAAAFVLPLALYVATLAPTVTLEDSGELITGAAPGTDSLTTPASWRIKCACRHRYERRIS